MKVAIVGTSPHWQEAPFTDSTWEIWSLGRNYTRIPRWDRWFELHDPAEIAKTWEGNEDQKAQAREAYFTWLVEAGKGGNPVYVQGDKWPEQVADYLKDYPKAAVMEEFGRQYFTNSIPYMIALALMEGATEIGVWGVDMALDSEYATQRPSVEYFIGIVDGMYRAGRMDAPLHLPDGTSLLKTPTLYALEKPSPLRAVLMDQKEKMEHAIKQLENQKRMAEIMGAKHEGGKEILEHLLLNWGA